MPGDHFIMRHWQVELQHFNQNLLLLREQINPEPIHDLRVAVKKLRSYIKLYAMLCNRKEVEEMLVNTKALFAVLGKHRNIEITRELLLQFSVKEKAGLSSLLLYLQLLQDQIAPFCQQAIQQYQKKELDDLTDLLQQDFANSNVEGVAAKVKEVITSAVESIKRDLKHFKKKSHLIRKRLKDIFYWSNMFETEVFFTKRQLKRLDKILDYLGNIQDHEVMITNLKNFRKTILPGNATEYNSIKKIEATADKKKEIFSGKANRATKELVEEI
jgi:CHAD domain-containing protein